MSGDSISNPPKLKPGEYETWATRFEAHVMAYDGEVWQIIEQGQQYVYIEGSATELKPRIMYTTEDYKKLERILFLRSPRHQARSEERATARVPLQISRLSGHAQQPG
ncbi:unnamed protein product [Rhodiola kirilowii]